MRRLLALPRRWWDGSEGRGFRELRARCGALGYALPRTAAETLADLPRAARRRRRAVAWRAPDDADRERFGAVIDVFADFLVAVAEPDGETWLLSERIWAGFPDPAPFAVLHLDGARRVIAAAELARLPGAWTLPDGVG